jgi:hypothetical protein
MSRMQGHKGLDVAKDTIRIRKLMAEHDAENAKCNRARADYETASANCTKFIVDFRELADASPSSLLAILRTKRQLQGLEKQIKAAHARQEKHRLEMLAAVDRMEALGREMLGPDGVADAFIESQFPGFQPAIAALRGMKS